MRNFAPRFRILPALFVALFLLVPARGNAQTFDLAPSPSWPPRSSSVLWEAGPPPPLAPLPAPAPPTLQPERYGGETLLVDALSLAAGVGVGLTASVAAGATIFSGGYMFGGPVVHLANERPWTALASLGLRAGAPVTGMLVGGLLGGTIGSTQKDTGDGFVGPGVEGLLLGGSIGAAVGVVAAVTIDAAVLARTSRPVEEGVRSTFAWTPTITPLHGGGTTVGISGTF